MKQSPGPTCLSRDRVSRATTLQDDKSSGGSPEDPHNLLTTSLQLLLLKQDTSLLNLSWETKFHKHCPLREVLVFPTLSTILKTVLSQKTYLQASDIFSEFKVSEDRVSVSKHILQE